MLCWTGVWAAQRVVLVLCVRVGRSSRFLAGRGVEVGDGCLGIQRGLWSVGSRWLLVDGARWHELRVGGCQWWWGAPCRLFVLLVRVHGPLWVYWGVWWPECCEPVQWGW